MEIKQKIKFVEGSMDTITAKLICVGNKNHGCVNLCVKSNMHIPIAQIKLHSEDLYKDFEEVYEDMCNLGNEIARRWNECETKL